jgi:hypothetical protein
MAVTSKIRARHCCRAFYHRPLGLNEARSIARESCFPEYIGNAEPVLSASQLPLRVTCPLFPDRDDTKCVRALPLKLP